MEMAARLDQRASNGLGLNSIVSGRNIFRGDRSLGSAPKMVKLENCGWNEIELAKTWTMTGD
jgi:hypothetical protein